MEPSRPCVWHLIYERADAVGRLDRLLEVQAPLDWDRVGRETWGTVVSEARERGLLSLSRALRDVRWREKAAQMFQDIRQPDWWQGDDSYHPPVSPRPVSGLQAALDRGEFVVTAEIAPPVGASAPKVLAKADRLRGLIHAANVTENPMANPRMSSLACGLLLESHGIEPIVQFTARDYDRLALQSEALGASALGIRNLLCLAGDPPELFLGAGGSPNDPDPRLEAVRLRKKINAGAQYIQTQLVYDLDPFRCWLEALDAHHLLDKAYILVGIGPLRSAKVARYMQEHIPDVRVPPQLIERLEQSCDPDETGLEIAVELIQRVKALPGVSGIHMMSVGWERILPRLLREAGLTEQVRSIDVCTAGFVHPAWRPADSRHQLPR